MICARYTTTLAPRIENNGRVSPLGETYWTYSFTPVRDDAGAFRGVLVISTESTGHVLGARRQKTLDWLRQRLSSVDTNDALHMTVASAYELNPGDFEAVTTISTAATVSFATSVTRTRLCITSTDVGVDADIAVGFELSPSILIGLATLLINALFVTFARKLIRQIMIRDRLEEKLQDYSEQLRQHNAGLEVLAHTEKLTRIANRRRFDDLLEQEFKRAQRGHAPLWLILMDLDFFKQFNDHDGHAAGDACLHSTGQVLSALVARYGGNRPWVSSRPRECLVWRARWRICDLF